MPTARWVRSEPERLDRSTARLVAFGAEVVRHLVGAVRPAPGRQAELDQAEARAERHEARIVPELGHAGLERERRAVAVPAHHIVRGAARTELRVLDRAVRLIDEAETCRIHEPGGR